MCWDDYAQFERYFNEQLTFVQVLNMAVCDQLTIRLHREYAMHDRSELDRWREVDPTLKIDRGTQAIQNLIRKSRLVVHSYDSTGLLETLSQNIPTMAFWQDGLSHVREGAQPYYQCLIDAGIIYTSPTSIAEKVNDVWPNVDKWWGSDEVQAARKYFCDRYARVSNQPISDLKQILVKNLASSGSKEVAPSG
jgi:putative transferase (TIGR04331 family)